MTVGLPRAGLRHRDLRYATRELEGFVGEKIDFRFLERTLFGPGMVMLYRASRDVHIQYPPDDLSVTSIS